MILMGQIPKKWDPDQGPTYIGDMVKRDKVP